MLSRIKIREKLRQPDCAQSIFHRLPGPGSIGPVGTAPQSGAPPCYPDEDAAAIEERQAPVESAQCGDTSAKFGEHVITRAEEPESISYLERYRYARRAREPFGDRGEARRGRRAVPLRIGSSAGRECGVAEKQAVRTAVDETVGDGSAVENSDEFPGPGSGGIRGRAGGDVVGPGVDPEQELAGSGSLPPAGTAGSCTRTPLLSSGRSATGFWTWLTRGAVDPVQFVPVQA